MALRWCLFLIACALPWCAAAATECIPGTRWRDDCNMCWCMEGSTIACTLRACVQGLESSKPFGEDYVTDQQGPPNRPGITDYKPSRSVVKKKVAQAWECQWGATWLEQGGCVECICAWGGKIRCRDSTLCLPNQPAEDTNETEVLLLRRRRQTAAQPTTLAGSGEEALVEAASSVGAPAAAALALEAPVAVAPVEQAAPVVEQAVASVEQVPATTGGADFPGVSTTAVPGPSQPATTQTAATATSAATVTATGGTLPGSNSTLSPPAITTAQATVVKERSCKSGSTWEEECNTCWCLDNGMAACTTLRCGDALPLGAPAGPAGGLSATRTSTVAPTTSTAPTAGSRRKRRFILVAT